MGGVYLGRESAAARWCLGIALTCVPYFGIAVLLHRFGKVTTPQAYWLIAVGFLLLIGCLALGLRAFMEHWYEGRSGGGATIGGVLLALAMLAPYAWHGYLAIRHPVLSDITTNAATPPRFVYAADLRALDAAMVNPFGAFDAAYHDAVSAAYPKLGGRRYNSGAERVYRAAAALVRDRGWVLLDTRGLESTERLLLTEEADEAAPELASGKAPQAQSAALAKSGAGNGAKANAADAKGKSADQSSGNAANKAGGKAAAKPPAKKPQVARPRDIEIEAVAASLLFGFANDVAITIQTEEESTVVDMRSSSRYGPHDFGSNERIIRRFLGDLDKALGGSGGEG